MLMLEQTVLQPPQLRVSVATTVSQPSRSLLLLQSAVPALQRPVQLPAVQIGAAMLLPEQKAPQAPQFVGSLATRVSQPSPCLLLLQSAAPALQMPVQLPFAHTGV